MKRWYRVGFFCCAVGVTLLCRAAEPTAIPPEDENPNAVRPTGVPPHRQHLKSKSAASTKSDSDESSNATPRPRRTHRSTAKSRESDEEPIPTQTVPGSIPKTSASSIIVIDVHSGQVLYEKNPDQIRAPASTTKLLTGLIVAESGNLDRPVTVQQVDTLAEPVKLNIKPGDTYQRIDLLRALLVKSPNDVARCLARDNAGSIEAFAARMNERAFALGARNSHFVNPNGLPDGRQYSTARDLSTIARVAYANSTIRSIVCLPQLVFRFANGRTRELENTNKLLKRLPYCNGMKTGYTEAAGKCLIASGTRPGKDIIVVVLGDSHSGVWRDAGALLAWALWNPSAG
jgi:serine-type D-Ala-D-Ala carboxypeptidase (penicillin-binding protein 5/6)